jgi:hypothetical protein
MRTVNLFLLGAVILTSPAITRLQAQITQGTLRVGPDLQFFSTKFEILGDELKTSSIEFSGSGGYYIIDNLELGLTLGFLSSVRDYGTFEERETGVSFGPHVLYKINIDDNLYVPVGGGLGITSIKIDDDVDEITFSGVSLSLRGGVEYIFEELLGVGLFLGPDFGTLEDSDTNIELDWSQIQFGIDISLYF